MEKRIPAVLLALVVLPGMPRAAEMMLGPSHYRDAANPAAVVTPTQPSLVVAMPSNTLQDFKVEGTTASLEVAPQWKFNTTLTADNPEAIEPAAGPQPKVTMGLNYKF